VANGSSAEPTALRPRIALGSNAAATMATAFLTPISVATMARVTPSASTAFPSWWWEDFRASSTVAIGSVSLIRIQNTGEPTGTKLTTFTSITPTTGTICMIAIIPAAPVSRLPSRFEPSTNGEGGFSN